MIMPSIPVQRYLVPEVTPFVPEGFSRVEEKLTGPLPHTIRLDNQLALVLLIPTGLANTWRDAEAQALVSSSADELAPARPGESEAIGGLARPKVPLRLLVIRAGLPISSIALTAGVRRRVMDAGVVGQGVNLELIALAWDIRAGNLRQAGDFGSKIVLAWRKADLAVPRYGPVPLNPYVVPRLKTHLRLESWSERQGMLIEARYRVRTRRFSSRLIQAEVLNFER